MSAHHEHLMTRNGLLGEYCMKCGAKSAAGPCPISDDRLDKEIRSSGGPEPTTNAPQPATDKIAWLIEHGGPLNRPHWLIEKAHWERGSWRYRWTDDANKATQYRDQAAAERAMRTLQPLPANTKATEHMWCDRPASSSSPTPAPADVREILEETHASHDLKDPLIGCEGCGASALPDLRRPCLNVLCPRCGVLNGLKSPDCFAHGGILSDAQRAKLMQPQCVECGGNHDTDDHGASSRSSGTTPANDTALLDAICEAFNEWVTTDEAPKPDEQSDRFMRLYLLVQDATKVTEGQSR